jgi:3-hydroxyacyl-CoA dehydrogenase/enoyl-CoA hydratase/3-hydroxybutyryl-CoA epimerase
VELRTEQRDDAIVTLWLSNPGRDDVVMDAWLLDQLHLFLDKLEVSEPAGLVIMSDDAHAFASGPDPAEIRDLDDEQLNAYLTEGAHALARIATLSCPTVAAINGACLGGGLELAMHCDAMVGARRNADGETYRIGLPEAAMGLCPAWGGTQMLPARIDPAMAIAMAATGATCRVNDLPDGLFDRMIDHEDDLHETAIRWIDNHDKPHAHATPRSLGPTMAAPVRTGLEAVRRVLPESPSIEAVFEAVEIGLEEGWQAGTAAERRLLISLRHTNYARKKLSGYLARRARDGAPDPATPRAPRALDR